MMPVIFTFSVSALLYAASIFGAPVNTLEGANRSATIGEANWAQVAEKLSGTWEGPINFGEPLIFRYEFTLVEGTWSGRWQNVKKGTWIPIKGLEVAGESVKFYFETQPEKMLIDLSFADGNEQVMTGTAVMKMMGMNLPMNLTKVSGVSK